MVTLFSQTVDPRNPQASVEAGQKRSKIPQWLCPETNLRDSSLCEVAFSTKGNKLNTVAAEKNQPKVYIHKI